jgi:hypothetical protein
MSEPEFHESHGRLGHEPGRTPERLVIVALALLIVLVVKPWGATPEPASEPGPVASVAPTPEVLSFADLPCTGLMWLVEADTRWGGDVVRTWILTDAALATGPTDPRVTFVPVVAQQVLAIGYCPSYKDDSRPHDKVTIYRLAPTVAVVPTQVVRAPREADASANDLYAPAQPPAPTGAAISPPGWPPGRYVMRIEGPNGYLRWLGVEVRIVPTVQASPGASLTP